MTRFLVFIFGVVLVAGCDDGALHGRFAVSSHGSRAVQGGTGEFMMLRGDPLPLTPGSGGTTPLLCVLVLAPGFNATGSGSGAENGRYVTTCEFTYWAAQGRRIQTKLTWDRRDDTVSAGGVSFDRKKGNAFVLIGNGSGGAQLSQVVNLAGSLTDAGAFQQVRAALPASSPARGVTLVP